MITNQRGGYRHFYAEGEHDGFRFVMRFSDHYGFWHCYAVQYRDVSCWQEVPTSVREFIQRRARLVEIQLMRTHPITEVER